MLPKDLLVSARKYSKAEAESTILRIISGKRPKTREEEFRELYPGLIVPDQAYTLTYGGSSSGGYVTSTTTTSMPNGMTSTTAAPSPWSSLWGGITGSR